MAENRSEKDVSLPSSKFFIRLCSWEQPPLPMPSKEGTVPRAMQQLTLPDPTTDNRDYSIHQGITMPGVAGRGSNVKYERRNTKQLLLGWPELLVATQEVKWLMTTEIRKATEFLSKIVIIIVLFLFCLRMMKFVSVFWPDTNSHSSTMHQGRSPDTSEHFISMSCYANFLLIIVFLKSISGVCNSIPIKYTVVFSTGKCFSFASSRSNLTLWIK